MISLLFGFDPISTQLCTYTIPSDWSSDYLVANSTGVWLGDGGGRRMFLDWILIAYEYTQWTLPETGYIEGLAFDDSGNLWWAVCGLGDSRS